MSWIHRLRERLRPPADPMYGLVLSGGGARSAYQAGVLQYIGEHHPDAVFPVVTGVSAGAINAAHLANFTKSFAEATHALMETWTNVEQGDIIHSQGTLTFLRRMLPWGGKGEVQHIDAMRHTNEGLIDNRPLREFLTRVLGAEDDGTLSGIAENVEAGRLKACALIALSYTTGQTVSWIQGCEVETWERANRVSVNTKITVEHIMASAALPFLFPAVRVGNAWYGDGGIRLTAPLSPAIHMGANRLIAVSTRYPRTRAEASMPEISGYPPTAQIVGQLMNAIFLDTLEQDIFMTERMNLMLKHVPRREWDGMEPLRLLLIRPSRDIGRMASDYQLNISGVLGMLTRGLGSDETKSPDWLSMLLFDPAYMTALAEIGYNDAKTQRDEIDRFFAD
ncbi:MAG: patatin-like phospholipase family protein [Bacteroidota bacterium]